MDFSQKLNFLFELTHARGKELSSAMNITPPQISKMRRGLRGMPKNKEAAETLSKFFALRCTTEAQKDALSRAMRITQVRDIQEVNSLAIFICDWLGNDNAPELYAAEKTQEFLRSFGVLVNNDNNKVYSEDFSQTDASPLSSIYTYFGSEGKRLATNAFLQYLDSLKKAFTINILTDEDMAWVTQEPNYSKYLYEKLLGLTESGSTFVRVVGPISDMNQAFDSLSRWLPFYMKGKATSYYFKRMRDNLNRITLFVVKDTAVMFSFSSGRAAIDDAVTFFTIDKRTANSLYKTFEKYLELCDPIMKVYDSIGSMNSLNNCMLHYEGCPANCIQLSNSLSFITLPWDVAISLNDNGNPKTKAEFLKSFALRYRKFKEIIKEYSYVDIVHLASIDEIMSGKLPIPASIVIGSKVSCYTPEEYLAHLRAMLYLSEHIKNYHIVIRSKDDIDATIIYVKEGHTVILARDMFPFCIFEVSERYLIDAFSEYLRRLLPKEYEQSSYKSFVSKTIRELITQLEHEIKNR